MAKPPYTGQVIIEKGFRTREAAEQWMNELAAQHRTPWTWAETHLWELASPIGAKEVDRA